MFSSKLFFCTFYINFSRFRTIIYLLSYIKSTLQLFVFKCLHHLLKRNPVESVLEQNPNVALCDLDNGADLMRGLQRASGLLRRGRGLKWHFFTWIKVIEVMLLVLESFGWFTCFLQLPQRQEFIATLQFSSRLGLMDLRGDHLVSTFLKRVFFGFFSNQYYCLPVQRILGINEWIVLKSNLTKTCSLLVSSRSRALHRLWVFQLQLPGLRHWKPLQRICRFVDALGGSVQQSPEVVSQRRGSFPLWSGMAELDYGLYPSREMQMVWLKEYLMAYKLFTKKSEEVSPRELETLYVQVNKFALVRDTRASC